MPLKPFSDEINYLERAIDESLINADNFSLFIFEL